MANEQKTATVRAALTQLDPTNDKHWTEDGLPREGVVRQFANDQNISRKDIQDAYPGFQRNATKPGAAAGDNIDPLTGEPVVAAVAEGDGLGVVENNDDPSKNSGPPMTESEVREVLEGRVHAATQALADRQQDVRDANKAVITAQEFLAKVRSDLTREFPPLTPAENVKQYIASENARRAELLGYNRQSPGSQIDAAFQRGNSRGWKRPSTGRKGVTQTSAARPTGQAA